MQVREPREKGTRHFSRAKTAAWSGSVHREGSNVSGDGKTFELRCIIHELIETVVYWSGGLAKGLVWRLEERDLHHQERSIR